MGKRYEINGGFSITDVSEAFRGSGCNTLQAGDVYLGRLSGSLGLLSAMLKTYTDPQAHASEFASRHLSDLNSNAGVGRFTIFGTELKADRHTYKEYVLPHLVSDNLAKQAGDFYVTPDKSRIDGISGLKGITLYEMRHACDIAEADLKKEDLVIIASSAQAIENIERNLKRLLSLKKQS